MELSPIYMENDKVLQPEHQTSMRVWQQSAPWHRRFSMRVGLENKLVLCFMAVLSAALGVTAWAFARETHVRLTDIMGEQARQLAAALSQSSQLAFRRANWSELGRRSQDLIKSRNILFVGYLDANAHPQALASRDPDFALDRLSFNAQSLMQVHSRQSPTFGEFLEVVAPILSTPSPDDDAEVSSGPRLLGYVAVGVSQASEEAQMLQVDYLIIGVGCCMFLCTLPIAYLLVHRIFLPIRKLVSVTNQICAGDLNARVDIHRPDIIGELARRFDDMVLWVKKHQEDLAQANRDLEVKVEQRTAQLETANERLSAEICEKEEFLRAVSHDLNAPLRNIGGMAAMLLLKYRENFDEEVVHRLERIQSNVQIETDLITELLELSRIKTRRQKMEDVDISHTISELRGLFEDDLRSKSIELIVDTPLPVLHAERLRIRQLFQNLIDNAIKYMGDGPAKKIHIGCQTDEDGAEFYVQDSGIGIDPEDLDSVFLIFRRGRNPLCQQVVGKGIGLASVKSIVEIYGGRIWVMSRPGQGSTFRFSVDRKYIPKCQKAPAAA
ncbi:MAG TPA: ATP-binding protein [Tepidisphaeraceae bacterium]|nr:ATP-binding protein [Tepidisphaeraceae bacterium]